MRTLPDLLRWRARRHPSLEALRQDGRALTYAELDAGSSALANGLAGLGIGPDDRVAVLARNSIEYVELLFALAKCGAVASPVNWRLQGREVEQVVADARAALVVTTDEFHPATAGVASRVIGLGELPRGDVCDPRRDQPGVVWQLSTSGTTGTPKGAMLTHEGVYRVMPNIALEAPEMVEGTRSLVVAPLHHVGGCGWAAASLWTGSTLVLEGEVVPERLVRTIADEQIGVAFLVPAVLLFLTQVTGASEVDFSSLRRIFYGASPITPDLLARCVELFGCRFTQLYGLTETTGAVTALRHEDHVGERLLSCGRPTLGNDIRVVGPEGDDLPCGEVGEMIIRSEQNLVGYFGRDGETAAVLRDGWFHTGDAGTVDSDGFLYIRDRFKDVIVAGGENVYPVEVEVVIAEHPDVIDVAVIGVPHPRWGETVKAVVVVRPGSSLAAVELIEFCRPRIAGFKRPTSVDFVVALPRNATGKVLKRELREPYWQGHERRVAGSG